MTAEAEAREVPVQLAAPRGAQSVHYIEGRQLEKCVRRLTSAALSPYCLACTARSEVRQLCDVMMVP